VDGMKFRVFFWMSFQVLTAEMTGFLGMVPCSLPGVNRRFRDAYCLNHHPDDGDRTLLLNVGVLLRDYKALYPRRLPSLVLWDFVLRQSDNIKSKRFETLILLLS
jgi:hypothetical protein